MTPRERDSAIPKGSVMRLRLQLAVDMATAMDRARITQAASEAHDLSGEPPMYTDGASLPDPRHPGSDQPTGVRWSARADLHWPVELVVNDRRIDAVTQNVGPQGAYLRCPQPLALDEIFDLCLRVPGAERPIRASARVVWSKKYGRDDPASPHGMGVHFCHMGAEDRRLINEAVRSYLRALTPEPGDAAPARSL